MDRPAAPASAAIRINLSGGEQRYRVESRTAVFTGSDTATAADSVVISAVVSATHRRTTNGQVALRGTLESMTLTSGLGTSRVVQVLQRPFTQEWMVSRDSVHPVAPEAAAGCDQHQETVRDLLLAVLPSMPDSLVRDQRWATKSAVKSCRGGFAIDVSSTFAMRVIEPQPTRANQPLYFIGEGSILLTGGGTQGATTATLRGSGSALSNFVMDLGAGYLRQSTTRTQIQLDIDMGYRTEHLVQRTERSITRID